MNVRLITRFVLASMLLALIVAGCGAVDPTPQPSPGAGGQAGNGTINGVELPPDAAPPEHQVLVLNYGPALNVTTLEFFESVYLRYNISPTVGDLFSDSLVRTNKNYQLIPGAATAWEVDASGLVWTFHLDPKLVWNDGTPVTAADYVATFRYAADPKHTWDFSWFYSGVLKNWDEVLGGKLPLDSLGVRAVDDHTLQFETIAPAPYLPTMLIYGTTFQQKALEKYGNGKYNTDPATSVSSGPFVLKQWVQGQSFVLEANPKYAGTNKPYIQKIIATRSEEASDFQAFLENKIDFVSGERLSDENKQQIYKNPDLASQIHLNYEDFAIQYLFFDLQNPPFNDLKVRQAFSHVIDREALVKKTLTYNGGIPAYSYLMPGFPAANPDAYKGIQNFDVALGQKLLAEAGYPGGKGFPKLTMWLRQVNPQVEATAREIAAMLKQNLGIEVDVANQEREIFAVGLNAKPTIQFGMISYGMDFLDPFNMLSVWLSGGRHNWNNAAFDQQVKTAAAFTGDPAERIRMFQDAERLLISDVAGVFIYHRTATDLYRPYLVGHELEANDVGVAAIHFPGYNSFTSLPGSLYISKDVLKYRAAPPKEPGAK